MYPAPSNVSTLAQIAVFDPSIPARVAGEGANIPRTASRQFGRSI